MMRRILPLLCLAALAGMLQGCVGARHAGEYQAVASDPYTLAAGDRVRVIVFGQDSLSNSFAVDSSGHIAMPLIGLVPALGRTPADLARDIEGRLRSGYVREPRVSVEIEAYRPFFVLGEVTTSGQYPYVNGMTVETAVAIAGGYTPRAARDRADLTRSQDGRTFTAEVPMGQPVKPGDTIVVRERFF
jgi:polysaccharide export outer membrane protein